MTVRAPASSAPVIVGYDLISPLGVDLETSWQALLAGESGVRWLTRFTPSERFPVRVAGEVPALSFEAFPFLTPKELKDWASPIFALAEITVHRALARAGLVIEPAFANRVAITYATAVGGVDAVLKSDRRLVAEGKLPPPFTNPQSCINMVAGKISMLTGATGPIFCPVAACATGATSLATGALLIAAGRADLVICGAVDAIVIDTLLGGFATMFGAFQGRKPDDRAHEAPARASRPFSVDRKGFVVAEGAGCVLLASPAFARDHGLAPRVALAGYSMTADAHHFVAPNRATVARCITEAIADAGIAPADVQLVNAHAASTKVGDHVEALALVDALGQRARTLPLTANKSQTGHAMGASSALETIFCAHGLVHEVALPTINLVRDPELGLDGLSTEPAPLCAEHALKNALGFGGANCCLLLRRID